MDKIGPYTCVEYLGDSVYLGLDCGQVYLFLYNGEEPHNEICLCDDTTVNLILALRKFGYKDLIKG